MRVSDWSSDLCSSDLNVCDNVGDCAGMAADLFETYAVTVVATMVLASIFFTGGVADATMTYPLGIGGVCIIASIVGTFFVKLGANNSIMGALYKGFVVSALLRSAERRVGKDWVSTGKSVWAPEHEKKK